jgi:hypothetical protein
VVIQPVLDPTRELPPVPADPSGVAASGRVAWQGRATPPAAAPSLESVRQGEGLLPGHLRAGILDGPVAAVFTGRPAPAPDAVRQAPLRLTSRFPVRGSRTVLLALGGAVLSVVVVAVGAGLLVGRPRGSSSSATPSASVTPIDPRTVHGSASSVQRPEGGISYDPGNTLDGNPATAWNSDGAKDGSGPGITLTYTFADPVDLRSVTLFNGYQKVRTSDGVDLWPLNERIRQLELITQAGQWTWDLPDTREPQTLRRDFGRTASVTLKITRVYRSKKYPDVAISEISFTSAAR